MSIAGRILSCIAVHGAVSLCFLLWTGGLRAEDKLDLTYLPREAVAAVVVHPVHLRSLPEFELVPFEIVSAAGKQEFGLDPLEVEQAIAFVTAPEEGPPPPEWGVILRFTVDQELSDKVTAGKIKTTADGVTYWRDPREQQPVFCLIDDRTLLIASDSILGDMADAKRPDGPLHQMLHRIGASNHLTAALNFAPVRDLVKQELANAPPLPPPLQRLLQIPDQLEAVTVALNLSRDRASTITLTSPDTEAADALQETMVQGLAFAKQMLLAQMMEELDEGDDPVKQATMQYMMRLANAIEKRLLPERSGRDLVIALDADYATTGVLVALLLPAVQAAREAARRTASMNNLKQIGLAMHNYHAVYNRFPPPASVDANGKPLLSWRVHLLPFVEEYRLYDKFHLDEPWDSAHNKTLIERMPAVYQCPNLPQGDFKTNYLAVAGPGTLFADHKARRIADIRDGTSLTLIAVEADADQAVVWTKPGDLRFDPQKPLNGLGSLRPGGFQALFADGASRFVSDIIDLDELRALVTIAGGEAVPGEF